MGVIPRYLHSAVAFFWSPLELDIIHDCLFCFSFLFSSIDLGNRDLPMRPDILPVLRVQSLGHAMHAFVNGEYVGKHIGTAACIYVCIYIYVYVFVYLASFEVWTNLIK